MKRHPPVQVFEYDRLFVDDKVFTRKHWEDLGFYNSKNDSRFFDLLPNGVRFKQYVGVIQVGNLTIEVLPKVDRSELNEGQWQTVLLDMLRECRWMQVHAHQEASLRLKHNNILDAYLEMYLDACVRLLHEGLVKKYRQQEGNLYALKGKLKFAGHISRNVVHQERFYTEHSIYDRDNIFNRILLKALRAVPQFTNSPLLKDKLGRLLLDFPDLPDMAVTARTFQNLVYDRKTERYKSAIEIAAMLLLNYRPDVRGGRNHVLAILFDMNELWEEYFYRRARATLIKEYPAWSINRQRQKDFWQLPELGRTKIIKPDIVLSKKEGTQEAFIIIDTKWKTPDGNIPSDGDLKQVFVYNEYWGAMHGMLLYPQNESGQGFTGRKGKYVGRTYCTVAKVDVLKVVQTSEGEKASVLNKDFAKPVLNYLINEEKD
ncbi:MAG: restriction endonuclease [Lewinellaceae bacterium]|nr:restriction endonuclease [Saprospiraceae bacterium]MCB9337189.1 restriction endonuclease [Lewinellaceae bacterium]